MKKSVLIVIFLLIGALVLAGVLLFLGGSGPAVTVLPTSGPISGRQVVTVTVKASAGLKALSISVLQGGGTRPVLDKSYPADTRQARESFTLAAAGLKEGPLTLVVKARDRSFFHFGGSSQTDTHQFVLDSRPPSVAVMSTAHNVGRGGAGLVVYSLNKEVQKSGVAFADRFFPGYRQKDGNYACLFAFPYNVPQEQFIPKVLAVDRAGNERRTGIYFHILPKRFRSDRIELTDSFLEKVASDFKERYPQAATPLEVFLKVNRDQRLHDLKTLYDCGLKSSPVALWKDAFLRLPNSAPRGAYGQDRTYLYKGKEVDRQTHLGVDLASLPHSPVPAANSGTVVYADDLGIYGQCIIIDHGMGLQSLYGHLSQIGVKVGDKVEKGAVIGRTGDTGLAGGDHLHFGIVVSGEQVNPIEWWDQKWINDNVYKKLNEQ